MTTQKKWLFEASVILMICALAYTFYEGLLHMTRKWSSEEYSHGYLIPFIAGYLIWRNSERFSDISSSGAWAGTWLVFAGLLTWFVGELSTLYVITQYAFLVTLTGIFLAYLGWERMRYLWAPLAYLFFMIPLPDFLYIKLSGELQLISSNLGVALMRLFGVVVHLEGNVIDLGTYRLQVVEACSGLRYLFPLTSFGFLCAYLFKGPWWQRTLLFVSTIPITVLMNSVRIGIIGILVEYWGVEVAEGFLHDFEGWVIFMACVAILFGEMWVFNRLWGHGKSFRDVFGLGRSAAAVVRADGLVRARGLPGPYFAALAVLLMGVFGSFFIEDRTEIVPNRQSFVSFPLHVEGWTGKEVGMEQIYIDALKLDDYIIADFINAAGPESVNFYAAYYASQRKGASVHSPSTCIPGDGWEITQFSRQPVEAITSNDGAPLQVNRVIIGKGNRKQLVYYWFPQRGRNLTNEYLVKWFLFWDSLTRDRTDGGLVRLVTSVPENGRVDQADRRLVGFLTAVYPEMKGFFPD